MPDVLPTAIVYSRAGCHLCEVMLEELLPLVRDRWRLRVVDIDADPELLARYDQRVPVLEFGGDAICQYRLDRDAVTALLDREAAPNGASPQR